MMSDGHDAFPFTVHAPALPAGGPVIQSMEPAALDEARRRLRVKLLRDLVSRGLYRVPMDPLAERLSTVLFER